MKFVDGNGPVAEMRCPGCLGLLFRVELGKVQTYGAISITHKCPSSRIGWITVNIGQVGSTLPFTWKEAP